MAWIFPSFGCYRLSKCHCGHFWLFCFISGLSYNELQTIIILIVVKVFFVNVKYRDMLMFYRYRALRDELFLLVSLFNNINIQLYCSHLAMNWTNQQISSCVQQNDVKCDQQTAFSSFVATYIFFETRWCSVNSNIRFLLAYLCRRTKRDTINRVWNGVTAKQSKVSGHIPVEVHLLGLEKPSWRPGLLSTMLHYCNSGTEES